MERGVRTHQDIPRVPSDVSSNGVERCKERVSCNTVGGQERRLRSLPVRGVHVQSQHILTFCGLPRAVQTLICIHV